ncbi:uncharacterized protein CLUP02_14459 [Colletotrichum lupini]|uniref:Uncharacterized protein n=1 Tax=Colletotrichum lupini TaxID=145971 RepID=A0A9Q8T4F2_9PEZI|nr:uncharacterized protein CLUP02_14459 [Colletotrichum lupini]UQC88932.1 hypothetical protein CLUP02_14459 [Colletotrichum lupini]
MFVPSCLIQRPNSSNGATAEDPEHPSEPTSTSSFGGEGLSVGELPGIAPAWHTRRIPPSSSDATCGAKERDDGSTASGSPCVISAGVPTLRALSIVVLFHPAANFPDIELPFLRLILLDSKRWRNNHDRVSFVGKVGNGSCANNGLPPWFMDSVNSTPLTLTLNTSRSTRCCFASALDTSSDAFYPGLTSAHRKVIRTGVKIRADQATQAPQRSAHQVSVEIRQHPNRVKEGIPGDRGVDTRDTAPISLAYKDTRELWSAIGGLRQQRRTPIKGLAEDTLGSSPATLANAQMVSRLTKAGASFASLSPPTP